MSTGDLNSELSDLMVSLKMRGSLASQLALSNKNTRAGSVSRSRQDMEVRDCVYRETYEFVILQ